MIVNIEKSKAQGQIAAPPSKSMAHRLLICAAMCDGISTVTGVSDCDDVAATIDCLESLGAEIEISDGVATVKGTNMLKASASSPLCCRESGSTLRFLIPIALLSGKNALFYGADSLMQRPMDIYRDLAKEKKMSFLADGNSIAVMGPLPHGEYEVVGNISSQFISGLLFALPNLKGDSRISISSSIESKSYIDLTIEALKIFGVSIVWENESTLYIKGAQKFTPCITTVEGDYSGAAFTEALNLFGGNVDVIGLNENSIQGDKVYRRFFEILKTGVPTIHIGNCPDLGPILFAIAAAKHGGVFTGTRRLKIKESDRAAAMADELKKFGVSVTVHDDKVIVYPADFHAPTEILNGHNDHRIVMSLAILSTITGGKIEGAEAINKSYPSFFDDLITLGIGITQNEA